MKRRNIISLLLTFIITSGVFLLVGILLLPSQIVTDDPSNTVDEPISNIDYYDPENCSILCLYEDGSGSLIYLDFENTQCEIRIYNDHAEEQGEKSKYNVNYRMNITADFLCRLCDRIGGIQLNEGSGERRYFSTGLRKKLEEKTDSKGRSEICSAFFEKFAKIGLSSDDFMFIIEETESDLSFPVCYRWISHFKEMASNCIFIKD